LYSSHSGTPTLSVEAVVVFETVVVLEVVVVLEAVVLDLAGVEPPPQLVKKKAPQRRATTIKSLKLKLFILFLIEFFI